LGLSRPTLYLTREAPFQSFLPRVPHAHGRSSNFTHVHGRSSGVPELRRKVAVKIRLKRLGKIRAPYYRIVVADSRTKRDGRVIEEIGKYHPTEEPSFIEIDSARAQYWLGVGAQPTEQVTALLKLSGDWGTFKGEKGAKSTIRTKAEPELFVADEKKKPVLKPKAEKPAPKAEAPAAEPTAAEPAAAEAAAEAVAAPVEDDIVAVEVETPVEAEAAAPAEAEAPEAAAETPAETVTDAEDAVDEAEGSGAAADEMAADDAPAAEADADKA
jgi:small subunit ribosomal protein S16